MWETHSAYWSQGGARPPACLLARPLHRSLCWPQCTRWTRPESDQSVLQIWPCSAPRSSCCSEHHFLDPPSGAVEDSVECAVPQQAMSSISLSLPSRRKKDRGHSWAAHQWGSRSSRWPGPASSRELQLHARGGGRASLGPGLEPQQLG